MRWRAGKTAAAGLLFGVTWLGATGIAFLTWFWAGDQQLLNPL